MSTGWVQFLLVVVPIISLIGSWLALNALAVRQARKNNDEAVAKGWNANE